MIVSASIAMDVAIGAAAAFEQTRSRDQGTGTFIRSPGPAFIVVAARSAIGGKQRFRLLLDETALGAPKRYLAERVLHGKAGLGSSGRGRRLGFGLGRRDAAVGFRAGDRLVRRDFGFTDEGGTFFDHDAGRLQVAGELGTGFQLRAIGHRDIAGDGTMNDDGFCADLAVDLGVLTERQSAGIRDDLAFDLTVENQFAVEINGSFDLNVIGQDVLGSGGGAGIRHKTGQIVEVHMRRLPRNLIPASPRSTPERMFSKLPSRF
jgi:hypothetical protein